MQSNPASVSRGVSQPDRVSSEEPPDLFSEEAADSTTAKSNGVHSDDDNDLFAGEEQDTLSASAAAHRPHKVSEVWVCFQDKIRFY